MSLQTFFWFAVNSREKEERNLCQGPQTSEEIQQRPLSVGPHCAVCLITVSTLRVCLCRSLVGRLGTSSCYGKNQIFEGIEEGPIVPHCLSYLEVTPIPTETQGRWSGLLLPLPSDSHRMTLMD